MHPNKPMIRFKNIKEIEYDKESISAIKFAKREREREYDKGVNLCYIVCNYLII